MKKYIIAICVLISSATMAQDFSNSISTQTPGLTEGAPALDTKTIQVEATFLRFAENNIVPTLFRYSPVKGFETRFTTTWQNDQHFVGLKYTLPFEWPVVFSVNGDIQLTGDFGHVRLAAYYPLGEDASISANYGRTSNSGFGIVQAGYSFSQRLFGFIEGAYGIVPDTFQVDVGLGFYVTPDFQVDAAVGHDTDQNTYIEFGGAFRIKHN